MYAACDFCTLFRQEIVRLGGDGNIAGAGRWLAHTLFLYEDGQTSLRCGCGKGQMQLTRSVSRWLGEAGESGFEIIMDFETLVELGDAKQFGNLWSDRSKY